MKQTTLSVIVICLVMSGFTMAQTVILSEDFEGGSLPTGWTQQTNATDGGWLFGTSTALESQYWTIPTHTQIAATNDDGCNCDKSMDAFISIPMDLSMYTKVLMSVDVFFQEGSYQGDTETGSIDVSTNGGTTWTPLVTLTGEADWRSVGIDLSAYAGMSSVMIGFTYGDAGGWLFGYAIDNVEIYEPLDYDIGISEITMLNYAVVGSGPVSVTGVIRNYGGITITSADVSWSVDGGTVNTQTITGLNIPALSSATFTHTDMWTPFSIGSKNIVVSTSNPNGSVDLDPTNDEMNMDIVAVDQVVQRVPLYENFTSSTCPPCVPANTTML